MLQPVRVLIVDDQPRARSSLRALLTVVGYVREIREAGDGAEAVRVVAEFQPDVMLIDVRMPVMDGLEATRAVKKQWPHVKVILLSMFSDYKEVAAQAGADAFITKGDSASQLLATFEAVAKG